MANNHHTANESRVAVGPLLLPGRQRPVQIVEEPTSGRIAVKVISHLGDEVMKVFRV